MWKTTKDFFLERFRQRNRAEVKKAFYLLLSTLTVFCFFCFLLTAHLVFQPGLIYIIGDLTGLTGCVLALAAFRYGCIETAGKVLIGFIIVTLFILTVVVDMYSTDPAIRYRLYVTLVCILATFFLFISFFRNIKQLVYFTVLFIGIVTAHFLVILHQIGSDPKMAVFAFEHYIAVSVGIVVATIISGLLVTLIEKLYQQATEQGQVIRRQNDKLHQTVDDQARFLLSTNESLKEFAYLTSHDLREPLRNISGFISLIRKNKDNSDPAVKQEMEEYYGYVQKGVKQMEDLINDIKEYSTINILEKNFSRVLMSELMRQVADTLEADLSRTQAVVRVQKDLPEVTGDKTLLFSLMQNLINNAIKYRKENVPPLIDIKYAHTEEGHVFSVSDNGIGIAEQYQEQIFFVFKRLHTQQEEYEGTGLGLAICKKAVEIHGGRIWLESQPGEGSTFYFSIRDSL